MSTPLILTPQAIKRVGFVLSDEPIGSRLRIGVSGGGCSGFQYTFAIDSALHEDDILIENGAAKVVVDTTSLPFLQGSILDFVDDLTGQMFKVQNPHATASCGCGTSFAI
jgi:iron-sulfur cluster assembly accessory protein